MGIASGKMNLAISGILLLTFMFIHPYGILTLSLFWVATPGCKSFMVRDIYRLEFEVFQAGGWVFFYIASVCIFSTHMCLGWKKAVPAPALEIPQRHHNKATHIGYVMTAFIALIYISFPVYGYLVELDGTEGAFDTEGHL